jgi:hypothetical protein
MFVTLYSETLDQLNVVDIILVALAIELVDREVVFPLVNFFSDVHVLGVENPNFFNFLSFQLGNTEDIESGQDFTRLEVAVL